MPFVEWDESYSLGVPEMDAQHKTLFAILNDLHSAVEAGGSLEALGLTISALESYGAMHFRAEEDHMRRSGSTDLVGHEFEHAWFLAEVQRFGRQFEANPLPPTLEVMLFLRDWLSGHVKGLDRAYAAPRLDLP